MKNIVFLKLIIFLLVLIPLINSCGPFKPKKVDARNIPAKGTDRVKKNIEEGRGFKLFDTENLRGGKFDFASSNELWRASLDAIDFMPLVSANYSGGIIITDWYSSGSNINESIKISIRFLTNEIRSDALDIKVFHKNCGQNDSCQISEKEGSLVAELNKKILSKATIYKKEIKDKTKTPYTGKFGKNKKSKSKE